MDQNRPKVGVGVMVVKDGKILLGRRKGAHGLGAHAGPGGHLEFMESFEDCARREAREEAGIEITNIRFNCLTNFKVDGKHYIDVGLVADWQSGNPQVLEPERCEGWDWHNIDRPPQPLFGVVANYLTALKTGECYFDA